jgi:hypothetical protein
LNGFLTYDGFVTSCLVLWRKLIEQCRPSKSWHISMCNMKNSPSATPRQCWSMRKLSAQFSLVSSNFIMDNKYQYLFSLKWQAPFFHFF